MKNNNNSKTIILKIIQIGKQNHKNIQKKDCASGSLITDIKQY